MPAQEFYLHLPQTITTGVVFSSPHSGRDYPADMVLSSDLNAHQLRSSEDAFVDDLFRAAPQYGAPLIAASVPRAYVDLNRGATELDPALIEGVRKTGLNPRVASGLGVIPRVVAQGRAIRQGKISRQEAERRLLRFYHPYHRQLAELLKTSRRQFGQVLLIDCHSMPHESLSNCRCDGGTRPAVVLGDRFGAACAPEIMLQIEEFFKEAGFATVRNVPFAGAFIAQNYGRPGEGQHVVQVEIDRRLYMNEVLITRKPEFETVQARLAAVIERIADLGRWPMQVAAQ